MSPPHSLESLAVAAEAEFTRQFGRPPRWTVCAPGRINLIGEHTDYNDGFVLPMAIDRHVVIAADASDGATQLFSTTFNENATVAAAGPSGPGPIVWARYVEGVLAGWREAIGLPPAFDAVVHSDLPLGGGLSSSAALEVAAATLLEAITGITLEPLRKAFLCQRAEHQYAGVPCGIMDQCASVLGQAGFLLLLDCRSLEVQPTPLGDPNIVAAIANTNVKHELTDGGYAARRRQCAEAAQALAVTSLRDVDVAQLERGRHRLDDVHYRRARHVVSENRRTLNAAQALKSGDWGAVGRLMYESHASLRDDFEVSCAELDVLVDLAAELGPKSGVIGSRMTGGGFGGCTVTLIRRDAFERVRQHLSDGYRAKCGREATVFMTRPVQGAHILARR